MSTGLYESTYASAYPTLTGTGGGVVVTSPDPITVEDATTVPGLPHFAVPFRLNATGQFAIVEQDSPDDVTACIAGVLRSRQGHRDDAPDRGITDPTFRQGGADLRTIRDALAKHEPRANRLIARDPALLEAVVDYVQITEPQESA